MTPVTSASLLLALDADQRAFAKTLAKTIPRIPGNNSGHEKDWIRACKGGVAACSNFEYSGPLSEMVLMGNLSIRFPDRKLLWDGENMKVTNDKDADAYVITHEEMDRKIEETLALGGTQILLGRARADRHAAVAQAGQHVALQDEGVPAQEAQEILSAEAAQPCAALGEYLHQPDLIVGRPAGEELAEAAMFFRDIEHEVRILAHRLDLLGADQAPVLA